VPVASTQRGGYSGQYQARHLGNTPYRCDPNFSIPDEFRKAESEKRLLKIATGDGMADWDPLRGDPRFEQIVASLAPKDEKK
jgi:hypothetical protein